MRRDRRKLDGVRDRGIRAGALFCVALVIALGCQRGETKSTPDSAENLAAEDERPDVPMPVGAEAAAPRTVSEPSEVDSTSISLAEEKELEPDPKLASVASLAREVTIEKSGNTTEIATHSTSLHEVTLANPDPSIESLLVFTPRGPLFVHLELEIDGSPADSVREEAITEWLNQIDLDHDGKPTWDEFLEKPPIALKGKAPAVADSGDAQAKAISEFKKGNDLHPPNGLVDRDELRRLATGVMDQEASFRLDSAGEYREFDPRRSRIWRALDVDADHLLTRQELQAARERLAILDFNGDEIIAASELTDTRREQGPNTGAMFDAPKGGDGIPAIERLGIGAAWDNLYLTFSELYTAKGRIRGPDLALARGLMDDLDLDESGFLDPDEISRLGKADPQIEITARFGASKDDPPGLVVRRLVEGLRLTVDTNADRSIVEIRLEGMRVRFRLMDSLNNSSADKVAERRLAELDKDKNGYLELEELGEQRPLVDDFSRIDSDGDKKLDAAELSKFEDERRRGDSSVIRAAAMSGEDPLFSALEAVPDGRLNARELSRAAEQLEILDRNQDGLLAPEEIFREVTITLSRGISLDPRGTDEVIDLGRARESTAGPAWFANMDTNGDGEISPREFLGTGAQFTSLDRNSDGFLDPSEASSAEGSR